MPGRSIRIARIAGIPVGVSPWWLVIVALFTYVLGSSYFPEAVEGISGVASYALGLVSVLLLFASILAHEFAHAIVARRRGIEIEEIDLWLLGGVAKMRGEAHEPEDELRYALAGPAVTGVIALCFGAVALLLPSSAPGAVRALVEYQAFVNATILVFNMVPAFPLDGGRVLRSLLWRRSGQVRAATEKAARVGRGFGYGMIALGALEFLAGGAMGLWLAVIGMFIVMAAGQQAAGAEVQEVLSGVRARELMSSPVVSIPGDALASAVRDYFVSHRYTSFPVVDRSGRVLGLLSISQLPSPTLAHRAERTAADMADRDSSLLIGEEEDVTQLLSRGAFARVGRAVVVDGDRRPVGLVSITDVERVLRVERLVRQAA